MSIAAHATSVAPIAFARRTLQRRLDAISAQPHASERGQRAERGAGHDPRDPVAVEMPGGDVARDPAGDGRQQHDAAELAQRRAAEHERAGDGREEQVGHVGSGERERPAVRARAQPQRREHGHRQPEERGTLRFEVVDRRRAHARVAERRAQVEERDHGDDHGEVRLVQRVDPVALAYVVAPPCTLHRAGRRARVHGGGHGP